MTYGGSREFGSSLAYPLPATHLTVGQYILLDASATDFVGFETLAFLVTILFRKLIEGKL